MGDLIPDEGLAAVTACPDCQSKNIRRSRSFYPMDEARIAGRNLTFWRCDNCGGRFLAARGDAPQRSRHRRKGSKRGLDVLVPGGLVGQETRKWLLPVMVILGTIVAGLFIFDRYTAHQRETGNFVPR